MSLKKNFPPVFFFFQKCISLTLSELGYFDLQWVLGVFILLAWNGHRKYFKKHQLSILTLRGKNSVISPPMLLIWLIHILHILKAELWHSTTTSDATFLYSYMISLLTFKDIKKSFWATFQRTADTFQNVNYKKEKETAGSCESGDFSIASRRRLR